MTTREDDDAEDVVRGGAQPSQGRQGMRLRRSERIAAQPRPVYKLRHRVRAFDELSEDPLVWLRHIEWVFALSEIPDDSPSRTSLAVIHLTGAAQGFADGMDDSMTC